LRSAVATMMTTETTERPRILAVLLTEAGSMEARMPVLTPTTVVERARLRVFR
jgi:hypothetical protein